MKLCCRCSFGPPKYASLEPLAREDGGLEATATRASWNYCGRTRYLNKSPLVVRTSVVDESTPLS